MTRIPIKKEQAEERLEREELERAEEEGMIATPSSPQRKEKGKTHHERKEAKERLSDES